MRHVNNIPLILSICMVLFIKNTALAFLLTANNDFTPQETISHYYKLLQDSLAGDVTAPVSNLSNLNDGLSLLVDELFDVERLAPQVLQNRWLNAAPLEQNRLIEAFRIALHRDILSQINKFRGKKDLPTLTFVSEEVKDKVATLNYTVAEGSRKRSFTVFLIHYPDGRWKINNMKYDDESLVRHYYSVCKKIIDRLSLSCLVAELSGHDYVVLEDFETSELGGLPLDWTWKKQDDEKDKPYEIREEKGNRFLAAEDQGESVILGKDIKWDLERYPYISFKWRVHHIPEGADERFNKKVDSAAGIYIIYSKKLGLIPESVKYVWSSTLPVGAAMRRSGTGRPWMVVAETGDQNLGVWRTYVFNVYEAYKKTFGGKPPDVSIAIGILSDANSMNSKAYADYDDIIALKNANADSGVKEFLKAE